MYVQNEVIHTEPKQKLPLYLSADIHRYETQVYTRFICLERVFYCDFV